MRWLVLQLADSAFPAGGFAHSAGLEAATQLGEAPDPVRFAEQVLWQAGRGALPLVRAAHEGRVAAADALADAALASAVANRASRTQGRAFVATCARAFPECAPLDDDVRAGALRGHLAPVWGAALARLGVGLEDALALYLHQALRGVLSAAVRLGALGPHEAQAAQRALAPRCDEILAACAPLAAHEIAQTAPLLELWGALHDRLYSRLFQS